MRNLEIGNFKSPALMNKLLRQKSSGFSFILQAPQIYTLLFGGFISKHIS